MFDGLRAVRDDYRTRETIDFLDLIPYTAIFLVAGLAVVCLLAAILGRIPALWAIPCAFALFAMYVASVALRTNR